MDLAKLLGVDINVKDIEKHAIEAEQKQTEMLDELKRINSKLAIIVGAAEEIVKHIKNTKG